jgi:serine/threonine protein kinase
MQVSTNIGISDPFIGHILADKYKVESVLREDDFGTVYVGTHLLMEKPVTIKILSPALAVDASIVERFSVEAKTISRLSHPNILNITDFGQDSEGTVFIVMEYIDGQPIKEIVELEGALSVERAVKITRQIAAGLSAAHSNKVYHTALSSEKVLVATLASGQDVVKMFDIGSFSRSSTAEAAVDTPISEIAYLSPEQCSRESEADERSDIYSLGIIFYELLTGEVPFTADTPTDLMLKHAEVPPPPLAAFRNDLPDTIEPILLNALAKNPDKRYQSAAAFAEDLSEAIRGENEEEAIVIPKVNTVAVGNGNNIWKSAFITLVGMTTMAFGFIYWTGAGTKDPITQLPTDVNSQPVQPLNPATGVNEQGNLMTLPPGMLLEGQNPLGADVGGGDGYDPWANVPAPRSGGSGANPLEYPVGPGGETYTIPPGVQQDGSIFMPNEDGSGVYLVPKPATPAASPSADPKVTPGVENTPAVQTPKPSSGETSKPALTPTPKGKLTQPATINPVETKTKVKPKAKPKATPSPPSSGNRKKLKSGQEQDT